jgi:bacterioferritin-associated ferredoxin
MIVCSCNVLNDQDVRPAVEAERTRSTSQVYGCLGCSTQCGRCARTICRIMDEALGNAHAASFNGCARSSLAAEVASDVMMLGQRGR